LTVVGNTLYFVAGPDGIGQELHRTNGAPNSAVLVEDITPGDSGNGPLNLTAVGSELWFRITDNNGSVWKSDGTEPGTDVVADIALYRGFVAYGGDVYFSGSDNAAGTGVELWKSDGTGATQVSHLGAPQPGGSSYPEQLTVFNGALYFTALKDSQDPVLYKMTGTEASITPITQLGMHAVTDLTKVGSKLFFVGNDGGLGHELWKSNGTPAGTSMVKDLRPGNGLSQPWFTPIGNVLYFVGRDATHGEEMWVSDGTAANTFMVQDFNPLASTHPAYLGVLNNRTVFTGTTTTVGRELLVMTAPRPTSLTAKATKKRRKLTVSGKLAPAHAGAPISVTFYKKKGGRYRKVATKKAISKASGAYVTTFRRARVTKCRITAKYGGHVDHLASTKTLRFRC
jgi:ELWxxDGT repeat protein